MGGQNHGAVQCGSYNLGEILAKPGFRQIDAVYNMCASHTMSVTCYDGSWG